MLFLMMGAVFGQSKKYDFFIESSPPNAKIFVNNTLIGNTPYKARIKFKFNEFPIYEIRISSAGYVDKVYTYTETAIKKLFYESNGSEEDGGYSTGNEVEESRYIKISAHLIKKVISDSLKKTLLGFDKMIFDIKEGAILGEQKINAGLATVKQPINWSADKYSTLEFNKIAEDFLDSVGFKVRKTTALFSDEKIEKNPDLLLGASLKSMAVSYSTSALSVNSDINLSMTLSWQIFNSKKNKVVAQVRTKSANISTRGQIYAAIIEAFENGLDSFINTKEFANALLEQNDKSVFSLKNKEVNLSKVNRPTFPDYSKMVSSSVKSTVTIKSDIGHGSGFLITSDGLIMTNYHVIEKAKEIEVIMNAGFSLPALVISYDEDYDVAIIKVIGNGFKPLFLKDTDEVSVGEEVIAIGTPKEIDLGQSVSKGIISGMREREGKRYIQTDASVNPGNSGGPLLNLKGEVLGIVSRKRIESEGIGYAIPINVAIEKLHITFK